MAKAVIYSDEDVLAAQQALRSKTARKVGKTRSQVAEFLADDIRKAIEQGYNLKDIKNILAEAGISVSVAKMQSHLKTNRADTSALEQQILRSVYEKLSESLATDKYEPVLRICGSKRIEQWYCHCNIAYSRETCDKYCAFVVIFFLHHKERDSMRGRCTSSSGGTLSYICDRLQCRRATDR